MLSDSGLVIVRKKIYHRIRILIENGVAMGRRSMFVVVGDKAKDQVIEGRMVAVAGVSTSVIQKGHKFENQ